MWSGTQVLWQVDQYTSAIGTLLRSSRTQCDLIPCGWKSFTPGKPNKKVLFPIYRMGGLALPSVVVALVLPSILAYACILVLSRYLSSGLSKLDTWVKFAFHWRLLLLGRLFMGRDLSANHLCPYLQGGENIKHAQQDRQDQVLFQLPPGSAPFCPGCLSSLLHLARHFLPNLPSPLCLPCWPVFFSSRLSSSVNCQSYLLLHNIFQVTIQESREGLAVWLLWGVFELIMKVTHCKTDF